MANDIFTVRITAFFGVVGYLLRKVKINPAPIVLAMVLVYMMESNFMRGMLTSGDDPSFSSPGRFLRCFYPPPFSS